MRCQHRDDGRGRCIDCGAFLPPNESDWRRAELEAFSDRDPDATECAHEWIKQGDENNVWFRCMWCNKDGDT